MAVIGTVDCTFLAAGVSANGRLYTAELIEAAVRDMQNRLADDGALPITMLSHHNAGDDSKELCGRVVSAAYDPVTGHATLHGYLIDTRAGKDIASAIEPDPGGRRTLEAVSIRGYWSGPVRRVEYEGQMVETGDALIIEGVDYTKTPGVAVARIANTARLTTETDARTPIRESVEVSVMTDRPVVYSTSTPSPADMPGARAEEEAPPAEEQGTPTEDEAADEATPAPPAKPFGAVTYADPGLQADKKARYPIDSKAHVKAAWSYINKPANQKPYTAAQVTTIKNNIKKAAKKYGVEITAEAAPEGAAPVAEAVVSPLAEVIAKLREARIAVSGWQGPVDVDLSAWGIDNDDVAPAMTQLGAAYTAALRVLDPDNDNDLDLPGDTDDSGDEDVQAPCANCAADLPDGAMFCPACGMPVGEDMADESADTEKETNVSETQAAESAPEKAAEETVETDATAPATDAAPAVAMTSADHEAIASLLHSKLTAAPVEAAKVDADAIAEAVKKATEEAAAAVRDEVRKEFIEAYGTPRRKGLVEQAKKDTPTELHKLSPEEFNHVAGQAWDSVLGLPSA